MKFAENQIPKKLNKLKMYKATGPDCLQPHILKELQEKMSKALCIIFNKSLRDGVIPSDWKTAHASAIYKKGCKSETSNYSSVSLTCIVCKLL